MKNKSYRLVIFDWEGTLSDTLGQVLNAVKTEAEHLNLGSFDEEQARGYVDLGLVNAIKKVFSHITSAQQQALLNAVQLELHKRHGETYLIPGAKKLIEQLQNNGILLAIATNKGYQSLQRALQCTGLDVFFSTVRSASNTAPKPDPEMIIEILDEFNLSVQDALMIGDSTTDMEMASSINMDAIGVNFYNKDDSLLLTAGAKVVFDSFDAVAIYLGLTS